MLTNPLVLYDICVCELGEGPSRGLLCDCENIADGSFAALVPPPVATHWMVRGSPSLKGPTGRELDSCLPRSPRIRGVEGGTE